jgi:hypothetical protein
MARGPIASPFFDESVTPWVSKPEPRAMEDRSSIADLTPRNVDYFAEKEGGQKGSNEGGFYRGSDNVLRYVKFYKDEVQGALEHLANNIYKDLGLPAVRSDLVTAPDGRQAYAREVVEGETLAKKGIDKKNAKQVLKGFAADVLVKNWDAVGLDHDNVVLKGGKAVRIDNGGAFLHRAKAGLKPESSLHEIDEWEQFLNHGKNPAYAKVAKAAGVSRAEDIVGIKGQIQAIQKLKAAHGGWGNYVDHVAPDLPKEARNKVVAMLAERASKLGQKLKAMKAEAKLPKPPKPARVFEELKAADVPNKKHRPEGWASRDAFKAEAYAKVDAVRRQIPEFSEALNHYTGGGYPLIRQAGIKTYDEWRAWRAEKYSMNEDTPGLRASYEKARRQYFAIDKAFELHAEATTGPLASAPEAKVKDMFRGLSDLDRATFDKIIGQKEFVTESVTSTSWDPGVAANFASASYSQYRAILHFRMKPTSRNKLAVETHSSQGDREKEILLRKGTRFRVMDVKKTSHNGALIELEEQDD